MKKRIVRPPMLQLPDCPAVKARASVAKTEDEVAGDGALWGVTLRRGRRRAVREDAYGAVAFGERGLAAAPGTGPRPAKPRGAGSGHDAAGSGGGCGGGVGGGGGHVFAVFDGHGGQRAAQYASKRLPERFVALRKAGACLTDALRQAFIDTDTEYCASVGAPPVDGGGLVGGGGGASRPSSTSLFQQASLSRQPSASLSRQPSASLTYQRSASLSRQPSASLSRQPSLHAGGRLASGSLARTNSSVGSFFSRAHSVTAAASGSVSKNGDGGPSAASLSRSHSLSMQVSADGRLWEAPTAPPSGGSGGSGGGVRPWVTAVAAAAPPPAGGGAHTSVVARGTNPNCGTTALALVLSAGTLTVAHAGDTRAVLAVVGGGAVRLSVDHRPSRPDELARIEASGGLVLTSSGTARVNGILAVSRSLGDRDLKAFVIADPEVATRPLTPVDEFVVVASDGVWDVLSDEAAVAAVGGALAGGCAPTAAASVLVRLAYSMGSKDDISALVVDLRVYAQQGWRATAGTPGVARGSVAALPIEEEKGARGWRAAATAKDGGPSPDGVADTARLTSPVPSPPPGTPRLGLDNGGAPPLTCRARPVGARAGGGLPAWRSGTDEPAAAVPVLPDVVELPVEAIDSLGLWLHDASVRGGNAAGGAPSGGGRGGGGGGGRPPAVVTDVIMADAPALAGDRPRRAAAAGVRCAPPPHARPLHAPRPRRSDALQDAAAAGTNGLDARGVGGGGGDPAVAPSGGGGVRGFLPLCASRSASSDDSSAAGSIDSSDDDFCAGPPLTSRAAARGKGGFS